MPTPDDTEDAWPADSQEGNDTDGPVAPGAPEPGQASAAPAPASQGEVTLRLPVMTILLLSAFAFSGLAVSGMILTSISPYPGLLRGLLPIGAMMALYALSHIFLSRRWIIAGQASLITGVLIFGFAIYVVGDSLRLLSHWPDALLIWALGTLGAAVIMPSRAALALCLMLACAWSSAESIYFYTNFHWPFLVIWTACFVITNVLQWRPGIYVGLVTLAVWLGLNSLSVVEVFYWPPTYVAGLHILLWLGLWIVSRILRTFNYVFATTFERASLGLALLSMLVLMVLVDNFGVAATLELTWLITAVLSSGLILLLMATALARGGVLAYDVFVVAGICAFAILYPTFYDWLYLNIANDIVRRLITGALYLFFAIWTLILGRREDDNLIIAFGCVAVGAQLFLTFQSFAQGRINLSVLLGVGGTLFVTLVIVLDRLRARSARQRGIYEVPIVDIENGNGDRRTGDKG